MKLLLKLSLVAMIFAACENKKAATSITKEPERSRAANDITFNELGSLKLKRAFLMYTDGSIVPSSNKAQIGEQVNMRLLCEGWKEKDGKVFIGASEVITNPNGDVVLNEKDLFASYDETGISPTDAETITLSAVITSVPTPTKYFVVTFRVWDKVGNGEISGSYKLYIQ